MKLLTGSLLVATAVSIAPLSAAELKVHIDGIGGMKCSAILTGMKEEPEKAANALLGWTYGYMARRNIERGVAGQSQVEYSKIAPDKVLGTINGFCGENANTRLYEIADGLYALMLQESAPTS